MDAVAGAQEQKIAELRPNIYLLRGEKPSSHVYLIRGKAKNVLIDTGVTKNFPILEKRLAEAGLGVKDVDLALLTHEHFDHIGATTFFHGNAVIAAHRLAANKLELQDEFVSGHRYRNIPSKPFWVDVWLEDGTVIDLGNYKLHVIHTPGHTSGCMSLYEAGEGLLFSGDTVFAGGTLSNIETSGNVSDYMDSILRLNSLRVTEIYPGHGKLSRNPQEDLRKAVGYARALLEESKTFFEAFIRTRELKEKSGYWKQVHKPED